VSDLPIQPVDEFFNEDLCVEAVFTPETGDPRVILVIFDKVPSDIAFSGIAVESAKPQAMCRDIDVAGVTHGHHLTIGGEDWDITDIQPDGTGITVLILTKAK
jgi:hypothetical protein